jgi:trk system potassium uptake protein TrkA
MDEFAVIGLGNFGAMVTRKLYEYGCRVTAVDSNKTRVQDMQEQCHQAIFADATDRRFLQNLEVDKFDSFIVSTGDNEHASILITLHLKEMKAHRIIVKANSSDHSKILLAVGADEAIIPEEEVAVKLARSLSQPNLLDFLPLSEEYSIAELAPPNSFMGKSIIDLELRTKYHVEVIAIKDILTGEFKFIPGGDFKIKDTDILVILGKEDDIEKIRS